MIFLLQNLAIFFGLIIFAYFSWRKIETGIWAIVFGLPLYLARLNVFGIPSTVLELGIYILFIIWLIKNYKSVNWREIIPDRSLRIGIILLLAGALVSTIFSSDLRASAGILKGWFFDPFLFFIILVSEIKAFQQKQNILKALFFSGAAVAAVSLLYQLEILSGGISYDKRLYGIYLSPNYLAMYLSPVLIIGTWLFCLSLRGGAKATTKQSQEIQCKHGIATPSLRLRLAMTNKYFLFILSIIIAVALYFTYSYSAWLALFVAIILLVCFMFGDEKKPSFQWKLGFLGILLFFILLFFSQLNNDRFTVLKNLAYRSSFHSRLMIWTSAWEIGKDNWLIGIGPGNFQKYYLEYQKEFPEPYLEWAVPQPHNIFLAFWLETGVLGLIGFIVILAWFFKLSLRLLKNNLQDKDNFLLAAVLFSIMIYIIIHGLFDTTYWKNDLAIVFWIFLALMASLRK